MYLSDNDLTTITPRDFREIVRRGKWTGGTSKACRGYLQTNITVLPEEYAEEFRLFCTRNPRPCPLIDITNPGNPHPPITPEADLRTDLPRYKVFRDGELVDEPTHIRHYWQGDLVSFLLGCSFSFDWLFASAGIRFHFLGGFITDIKCEPAGDFKGPMVVTCRQFQNNKEIAKAIEITSQYPFLHGSPIHVGEPNVIGIKDINKPDFCLPIDFGTPNSSGPVFWGCGITTEMISKEARLPLMITQGDTELLVTDKQVISFNDECLNIQTGDGSLL